MGVRFGWLRFAAALVAACLILGCDASDGPLDDYIPPETTYVVPPVQNDPPPWPEWVLTHWVWEDESTQGSAAALVEGYRANDIPVGAIIIDSPWATGYSTFVFDPLLFPDAQQMIDAFHADDVRVFCWTVPLINIDSPNYLEAFNEGYFINQGRTLKWWKGRGSAIDYLNPDALAWWHGEIDNALTLGIDGWKTDMGAIQTMEFIVLETYQGPITWQDYKDIYYRDFFNYTRAQLGDDRVITARPVDSGGLPSAPFTFAPPDVNFAGWVGDQQPTFDGLGEALNSMFLSSEKGYVNFGSDICGYFGDGLRDKELLIRWAQLGALTPVMENGGNGEHRPWMYDAETVRIYRDFAELHTALIPYLYSQGAASYQTGVPLMRPLAAGDWHYLLGDSLLVAAIAQGGEPGLAVTLPAGATWIDWFTGVHYEGGQVVWVPTPLEYYPLFVREGAIVPMDLGTGSVFLDDAEGAAPITAVIFPAEGGMADFDVYEEGGTGARIEAEYGTKTTITLSATERAYAVKLVDVDPPDSVEVDPGGVLNQTGDVEKLKGWDAGWLYDAATRSVWIKIGDASEGAIVTVR